MYENLNTAYVNLAALLRYLQQSGFVGRLAVELDEYTADVRLNRQQTPHVRERDFATGRDAEGDAALQRLLVRASMTSGTISVYKDVAEDAASDAVTLPPNTPEINAPLSAPLNAPKSNAPVVVPATSISNSTTNSTANTTANSVVTAGSRRAGKPGVAQPRSEADERPASTDLLRITGEVIAAVERAVVNVGGGDFTAAFHQARLSAADDYPFLDPSTGRFHYSGGFVRVSTPLNFDAFVAGVSEALRRVVERIAADNRRSGGKDRAAVVQAGVARELAILKQQRSAALTSFDFSSHLERIAGHAFL